MKATVVRYEKLFNLGGYSHEKIGVEIALDESENATQALDKAKKWVASHDPTNNRSSDRERAERVLADRENRLVKDVIWAENYLKNDQGDDDLQF